MHKYVIYRLQQNSSSNRHPAHDAKYTHHYDYVCNIFGTVGLTNSSLPPESPLFRPQNLRPVGFFFLRYVDTSGFLTVFLFLKTFAYFNDNNTQKIFLLLFREVCSYNITLSSSESQKNKEIKNCFCSWPSECLGKLRQYSRLPISSLCVSASGERVRV